MTERAQRLPIIGGNWKMHTTVEAATDLAAALSRRLGEVRDVEVVLFPPFTNLAAVHQVIAATSLQLGGQDLFWEDLGAYTGEISAPMLRSVGCDWVLVGHSERRRLLGDTSRQVNQKLHAALRNGLRVVLALGESKEERQSGQTEQILEEQLRESLEDISPADLLNVVIAYEPVWAIGTGDTASTGQVCDAHLCVRRVLSQLFDRATAEAMRIQYGGSVTSANAAELLSEPDVDGALVGGASLKPDDFKAIVQAASR